MPPNLPEIEELARQAGKILRDGYGKNIKVDRKGVIDLVTEMDHRSEAFLIDSIQRRYPTHRIVAEESGAVAGASESVWYIDPLDGTVNYAHGFPLFSVSLAFAHAGELLFGAVYNPVRDECFTAGRGEGAWLNGEPIRVSTISDLDQSLLVTGFPYDIRTNPDNNLDRYNRFSLRTQGVRRLGSAALDLGYVAAGWLDGFWELRLNPWDVAAGALIVQEAGGVVTDLSGDPDFMKPPYAILAANPKIHPQMVEILG